MLVVFFIKRQEIIILIGFLLEIFEGGEVQNGCQVGGGGLVGVLLTFFFDLLIDHIDPALIKMPLGAKIVKPEREYLL